MNSVMIDECTCNGSCCCAVPFEFVRLRYFFGQRLGVVDFADEQGYHTGKQRFHNLRAHGAGVLCGLRAERFVFPAGSPADTPTTVLRVRRGAALDACGREIVVGSDQCIDVAAWFLRNRGRPELADFTPPEPGEETTERRLTVALRYRECPSDPSPAPRDPCGCDDGGCEFGRVRENFELALLTDGERACVGETFPTRPALRDALDGAFPQGGGPGVGDALLRALHLLVAADCAAVTAEGWLCLASFAVTLEAAPDGSAVVTDIAEPDNAIPERASLLASAALQEILLQLAGGAVEDGALGSGPRITGLAFDAATSSVFLPVALAPDGAGGTTPLAEATFDPGFLQVMQFDDAAFEWQPAPAPAEIVYEDTPEPRFRVSWNPGDLLEARYRIVVEPPFENPVVDRRMRPLRPLRFARHFRLVLDAASNLTLAETLFD